MSGWIKSQRSMKGHWLSQNSEHFMAWHYILYSVNWEDKKVSVGSKLRVCKRGEAYYSIATWAGIFGGNWTPKRVRNFFKMLSNDDMIKVVGLSKTTRLSVCNYSSYQDQGQTEGEQKENTGKTQGKHRATTKEVKEVKELKEVKEECNKPTLDACIKYAQENCPFVDGLEHFEYFDSIGWLTKGKPIKNWKIHMRGKNTYNKSNGRQRVELPSTSIYKVFKGYGN